MRNAKFSIGSYKGLGRRDNRDSAFFVSSDYSFLMGIFDGVSSASGSGKGVNIAKDFIVNRFKDFRNDKMTDLSDLIFELNKVLCDSGLNEPFMTYAILEIPKHSSLMYQFSSMGDSRIYAVSSQYVLQLTKDDSINENFITKYLGRPNLIHSDFQTVQQNITEKAFLLCTDGFYSVIENEKKGFLEIIGAIGLKKWYYIKNRMDKLMLNKNNDDATYVLVRIEDSND
jgi:serine/threonine protein phosphatase PrpC